MGKYSHNFCVGAIIQARMTSKRLPGKVLMGLPYGGRETVLEQVIKRVRAAKEIDQVIVATTQNKSDDGVCRVAKRAGAKAFRGSENDVLSRFYLAAKKYSLDYIVRITADCPCIDPKIIDLTLAQYFRSKVDYISYCHPRGIDVEVIPFKLLEVANQKAKKQVDREHVSKYIYENDYKVKWFEPHDEIYNNIRVTLDTTEDYLMLCALFDQLYRKNKLFGKREIVALYRLKPWIFQINRQVRQTKQRGLYQ